MHHIRFKFLAAEAWKYFSNLHRIMFLTAPNTSSWCWRHELSVQMWKIFKFYERHETQICAGGRKGLHHFAMMILCLHAFPQTPPPPTTWKYSIICFYDLLNTSIMRKVCINFDKFLLNFLQILGWLSEWNSSDNKYFRPYHISRYHFCWFF